MMWKFAFVGAISSGTPTGKTLRLAAAVFLGALLSADARAAAISWTGNTGSGGGGNSNFYDNGNWSPNPSFAAAVGNVRTTSHDFFIDTPDPYDFHQNIGGGTGVGAHLNLNNVGSLNIAVGLVHFNYQRGIQNGVVRVSGNGQLRVPLLTNVTVTLEDNAILQLGAAYAGAPASPAIAVVDSPIDIASENAQVQFLHLAPDAVPSGILDQITINGAPVALGVNAALASLGENGSALTAIPEPQAAGIFMAGALAAAGFRRRRSRS